MAERRVWESHQEDFGPVVETYEEGSGVFSVESTPGQTRRLAEVRGRFLNAGAPDVVGVDVLIYITDTEVPPDDDKANFDIILRRIELSVTPGSDFSFFPEGRGVLLNDNEKVKVTGTAANDYAIKIIEEYV